MVTAARPPLVGALFVGGQSRRMGRPKAGLPHPDGGTLLEHGVRALRGGGVDHVVLVGRPGGLVLPPELEVLDDAAPDQGPLAGLVAALARAPQVVVLACDLPWLDGDDVRALRDDPRVAPVLAPRRDGRWEPLFARYDAAGTLEVARQRLEQGARALQGLLDAVGAMEHRVRDPGRLADWDAPDDLFLPRP